MPSQQSTRPIAPAEIYQLEITLSESKPAIWRRIRLLGDTSRVSLHLIIQQASG